MIGLASLRFRGRDVPGFDLGAPPTPDAIYAQALAYYETALGPWLAVQAASQAALSPGQSGWVDPSYTVLLQDASKLACLAASTATAAARAYGVRCPAASAAAGGASSCPSLGANDQCGAYPNGMLPAGSSWGTEWNGQANVVSRNCIQQVGQQMQIASSSLAAARAARAAACPAPAPAHLLPLHMR